jgi:hypothetical protein
MKHMQAETREVRKRAYRDQRVGRLDVWVNNRICWGELQERPPPPK